MWRMLQARSPDSEDDHSSPSSDEAKNLHSFTISPSMVTLPLTRGLGWISPQKVTPEPL